MTEDIVEKCRNDSELALEVFGTGELDENKLMALVVFSRISDTIPEKDRKKVLEDIWARVKIGSLKKDQE